MHLSEQVWVVGVLRAEEQIRDMLYGHLVTTHGMEISRELGAAPIALFEHDEAYAGPRPVELASSV